jgi:G3E family GTPase
VIDYITVGGFLGAGKTTALLRLGAHFRAQGRRVGLITNDQGHELVDTRLASASGHAVQEVAGGCFCCRFETLSDALSHLGGVAGCTVLLAEPVGSCTDVRATVQYPLARLRGRELRVAPLSVVVDPFRAAGALSFDAQPAFSPNVQYIFDKQLEEADIVVLNKRDALSGDDRARLERALEQRVPHARVVSVSALTGENVAEWIRLLSAPLVSRAAMDVDYDTYADGEARLGWVNAAWQCSSAAPFDADRFITRIARSVQYGAGVVGCEIAHFKAAFTPVRGDGLAAVHLVGGNRQVEPSRQLGVPAQGGTLIVNLRAEGDPQALLTDVVDAVSRAAAEAGLSATPTVVEHFRPGRPEPTHRVADP